MLIAIFTVCGKRTCKKFAFSVEFTVLVCYTVGNNRKNGEKQCALIRM